MGMGGTGAATAGGGKGGAGGAAKVGNNYSVNPMNNAANGMQDVFRLLQQAAGGAAGQQAQTYNPATAGAQGYTAAQGTAQGYNPAMAQSAGYSAAQGQAGGYNPALMQGQTYNAAMQQSPEAIHQLMGNYQNPYQQEVIDRTTGNMQRNLQTMQEQNAAQAASAGAFGGSRHGLVEATTNAEVNRNIGDMSAQLNQQGFDTAAGLAGQDISNLMNVRGQNQAAQNNAGQFNAGNLQQAAMANQGAQNDAGSFLAAARNAMSQFNTGESNAARAFTAGNQQQTNLANQGASNDAGSFLAAARNAMSQYNAGARDNASQFGAAAQNNVSQFNANSANTAGQYNAGARERNQQGRIGDLLSIANGLSGAAQQSYGMGTDITDRQNMQGAQQQALLQQILSGQQGNFNQYTQNPQQMLNMLMQAAGMSPLSGQTTTTGTQQTPNTLGGNLLGALGNMFQLSPIALSSARFKHDVQPTGRKVKSVSGKVVDEVSFKYLPEIEVEQACYTGVIAEQLGDDPAVIMHDGQPLAVDYSKLEVV